jgi:chromosomal replication initiator protein
MHRHKSLARFIVSSENRSAYLAVTAFAEGISSGRRCASQLLVLHGLPGTGKSHLVSGFTKAVSASGGMTVQVLSGGDFREPLAPRPDQKAMAIDEVAAVSTPAFRSAHECDVLILEDLQRVPYAAAETVVHILDQRQAHALPTVVTSTLGPSRLMHRGVRYPARLTNRLAAGLVVALEPLRTSSRQKFLEELAQRIQLALPGDIAHWLARNLTGGGRQLEGAITKLAALGKVGRGLLDKETVMAHFRAEVEAIRPTVERITDKVGRFYRVEPRKLQSRGRQRAIMLPRQISMYLARDLTPMSLEQIGAYFGGRDHTTVLHACRKVERALKKDAVLSGTVRQIHAELA